MKLDRNKRFAIVLTALCFLLTYVSYLYTNTWWAGLVILAAVILVGVPISVLLTYWIEGGEKT